MNPNEGSRINIAMLGHVDHGKSTVLGRLLYDSGALPKGKLEAVKNNCKRNSKPFEYAFFIDSLKDEQSQGITIDSARVFFKHNSGHYLFLDAPGHIEFLRNMITGAASADFAYLVIDANEGVQENSRRHGFLASMLGIKNMSVLINKMDLISYDENVFNGIKNEYKKFMDMIDVSVTEFIPVSGMEGDNIVSESDNMSWYKGHTLIGSVQSLKKNEPENKTFFRMPVQGVYKFTAFNDTRRIVSGTVTSGSIKEGEDVVFYPSGKRSRIKSIEYFGGDKEITVKAGQAAGFTLTEQIYVKRGEVVSNMADPRLSVTSKIRASLFWLGNKGLCPGEEYIFKIGTDRIYGIIEKIEKVIDPSDLEKVLEPDQVHKNCAAECIIKLNRPAAFDVIGDSQDTGRFVIISEFNICGGGILRQPLEDGQTWIRDKVFLRDFKWEKGSISRQEKEARFKHRSAVVFITGEKDAGKKTIARALEETLFHENRFVYFMGIGNLLYGIDADIKGLGNYKEEHLRRLAEVAHLMMDTGIILIITAIGLTKANMTLLNTAIGAENVIKIWVGRTKSSDIESDLDIRSAKNLEKSVANVKKVLENKGIL